MELVKINSQDYGIAPKKANELIGNLPQIKSERTVLEEFYLRVIKMDIEKIETSKAARELRLKIRENRTKGILTWHKRTKDYFLKGGQFVDAIKRKEVAVNERMEEQLEEIEKHFENVEKQKKQALHEQRIKLITPFVDDTSALDFRTMEEDVFEAYFIAKKTAYENKIAAEKQAEKERIAKAEAEAEAREKQRLENARLKKEAEVREREMQKEREKQAKILAKQKTDADAKLKKEQEYKRKLEAELQAQKDKEEKAKREKLKAEKREKLEAEKRAKAPIKKQLSLWVNSFELPNLNTNNEKKLLIKEKFEAFKKWAKTEIENI